MGFSNLNEEIIKIEGKLLSSKQAFYIADKLLAAFYDTGPSGKAKEIRNMYNNLSEIEKKQKLRDAGGEREKFILSLPSYCEDDADYHFNNKYSNFIATKAVQQLFNQIIGSNTEDINRINIFYAVIAYRLNYNYGTYVAFVNLADMFEQEGKPIEANIVREGIKLADPLQTSK